MKQATRRPVAARREPREEGVDAASTRSARWLSRLMAVVSLASVVVMVMGVMHLVQDWQRETPIRSVRIDGQLAQLDRAGLQLALERSVRGSFFTVNLDDLVQAARRFPWVASVQVSREWPDSVRVEVVEKIAVARWGDSGLLTAQGEVFRPQRARGVERLPVLSGQRAQSAYVLAQYQAMEGVLREVGLSIERLHLTDRMSWVVGLEGDIELLVDGQDSLAKLARFIVLYDRQLAADVTSMARVDLRYRNGVAIGWRRAS